MSIDWSKFPRDVNTPNYIMRPAFQHVKARMGRWLVGAEIGIYLGETAEYALRNMELHQYVMIDPYIPHGDMQRSAADWSEIYEKIHKLFVDRPNVKFMRATSEDAAKTFPDGYFDFVYIDGNHEYEYVEKDLNSWYNKVKDGGVLCGHDYGNEPTWAGVKKAVDEFATRKGLIVQHKEDWYTHVHDWWVDK
jgi:SAM-dependent methyltransferase